MTTRPALQKIPEGILHIEEEDKHDHKSTGKNKPHFKKEMSK
jgi:hypothetical protein